MIESITIKHKKHYDQTQVINKHHDHTRDLSTFKKHKRHKSAIYYDTWSNRYQINNLRYKHAKITRTEPFVTHTPNNLLTDNDVTDDTNANGERQQQRWTARRSHDDSTDNRRHLKAQSATQVKSQITPCTGVTRKRTTTRTTTRRPKQRTTKWRDVTHARTRHTRAKRALRAKR